MILAHEPGTGPRTSVDWPGTGLLPLERERAAELEPGAQGGVDTVAADQNLEEWVRPLELTADRSKAIAVLSDRLVLFEVRR